MDFEGNTPFPSLSYNNTVVLPKGLLSYTNSSGNMHTIPTMTNNNTNTDSIFITNVAESNNYFLQHIKNNFFTTVISNMMNTIITIISIYIILHQKCYNVSS